MYFVTNDISSEEMDGLTVVLMPLDEARDYARLLAKLKPGEGVVIRRVTVYSYHKYGGADRKLSPT